MARAVGAAVFKVLIGFFISFVTLLAEGRSLVREIYQISVHTAVPSFIREDDVDQGPSERITVRT
jgi:hypothetical protein